jgi:hypothetical protein
MRSLDFCYWLEGFIDLRQDGEVNADQVAIIQRHLSMVFKYEIDPSFGDANADLSNIHNNPETQEPKKDEITYRC